MIEIEIDDRAVRQAIEDLRRRASNMRQAMHTIGQALMEGSRSRILAGKDWTGQPFAPNSPVTLARKKGNKPLIDQKTLVTSRLFYRADADSVEPGHDGVGAVVAAQAEAGAGVGTEGVLELLANALAGSGEVLLVDQVADGALLLCNGRLPLLLGVQGDGRSAAVDS